MSNPGYIFTGWRNGNHIFQPWQTFRLPEGSSHFYFYATWAPAVLLTLDANNGTHTTQQVRRGANTQMRNLPQPPTKPGYIFLGWFSTPDETGGTRLTTVTTIPDTDTTYWARWREPISVAILYENLVNSNTLDARNQADTIVNDAVHLFLANFGINLVQQSPARYESALNNVGTSAPDVLGVNPSGHASVVFRFVDFPLSNGLVAGLARQIRGQEGTALMHLGDMVVSTGIAPEMLMRAVVHEISHVLGAHDCTNFGCVMDISWLHTIHDRWCADCQSDIHNYMHNRIRNNPQLNGR